MTGSAEPGSPRVPLWAGRTMALVGIVLVSLNLRTAATSLSPIVGAVSRDIPLDALGLAVLGMLPPIMFALSGLVAPRVARRLGLELSLIVSIVAMIAALSLRAVALEYWALFGGTLIALIAAGAGNILLPPIVKRYFPDRIGLITSLYATAVAAGTALPPAVAFPIADAAGWRTSLAVWAILAMISLPPWIVALAQRRRSLRSVVEDSAPELEEPAPGMVGRVWHSRTAWVIAIVFSLTSFQAYSLFAWLPKLLVEQVGTSELEAGLLLAFWGILGMGASLVAPILATRLKNAGWILHVGAAGFVIGYLGLLLAPAVSPWLWVGFCGLGQMVFPACLALINLRTRSHDGSIALSGFAQGVGYSIASLGPLLVGLLHDITDGWAASLILMSATAALFVYFGFVLRIPRFVEDETAGRR
ncbi:CP family cyanate transporter-like MFS transporter [Cryobacterium mesophilum]|uniref:MFS transporter n=1 Tax=Terrimesophilobacter mesophilus TaxID=433647 RepID=A0A4R8V8A6_9MICO|nr:MFS transporter [Terrimesophilobacter mesophilus]MBB5634076.1 CP family cyanate transporter-like MFS transporter [Terrimesophilobacter mesophilus]TFB78665.1 MFS transporter [Terrimesophilobacter mesophilus]